MNLMWLFIDTDHQIYEKVKIFVRVITNETTATMSIILDNEKAYQCIIHEKSNVIYKNNPDLDFFDIYKKTLDSNLTYDYVYDDVMDIANIARSHGWKLYGGVVRSFLLRKENTSDIDIWFTNQKDYDDFVERMKKLWNLIDFNTYHNNIYGTKEEQDKFRVKSKYPFAKERFVITNELTKFTYNLDLVCNETLPVNDFNVNCVTYDGKKLESSFGFLQSVLEDISFKRMWFIPKLVKVKDSYYEPTDGEYMNIMKEFPFHSSRVNKFVVAGWKILDSNDAGYKHMGYISEEIINMSIKE